LWVDNIKKNNTERKKEKEKTVTTVTKHVEKYLTTQFQTQAMNIDRLHRFAKRVITRLILN